MTTTTNKSNKKTLQQQRQQLAPYYSQSINPSINIIVINRKKKAKNHDEENMKIVMRKTRTNRSITKIKKKKNDGDLLKTIRLKTRNDGCQQKNTKSSCNCNMKTRKKEEQIISLNRAFVIFIFLPHLSFQQKNKSNNHVVEKAAQI